MSPVRWNFYMPIVFCNPKKLKLKGHVSPMIFFCNQSKTLNIHLIFTNYYFNNVKVSKVVRNYSYVVFYNEICVYDYRVTSSNKENVIIKRFRRFMTYFKSNLQVNEIFFSNFYLVSALLNITNSTSVVK